MLFTMLTWMVAIIFSMDPGGRLLMADQRGNVRLDVADRAVRVQPNPDHAIRLTFDVDGDNYRLRRAYRIRKRPPAGSKPPAWINAPEQVVGFWVEIRNSNDEVLFFTAPNHPLANLGEAPGADAGEGSFERSTKPSLATVFSVVVPDFGPSAGITLMGSSQGELRSSDGSIELWSIVGLKPDDPPGRTLDIKTEDPAGDEDGG